MVNTKQYRDSHKEQIKKYNAEYRLGIRHPKTQIPKVKNAVVYAYFDKGICMYVGRGSIARVYKHRNMSTWWKPSLLLIVMTCSTEWEAMEYEGKWGGRYLPKYNKDGYRY